VAAGVGDVVDEVLRVLEECVVLEDCVVLGLVVLDVVVVVKGNDDVPIKFWHAKQWAS
jgi:hypothetical protein